MNDLESTKAFFMDTYTLAHIQRFSMVPVVRGENVATHSYFVALCVLLMHEHYDFKLKTALAMAISHDVPEMYMSDINHAVKKRFPALAKAVHDVEKEVAKELPAGLHKYITEYEEHESPESLIVRYADTIQCMQYAKNEVLLGNKGYMADIYKLTSERLKECDEQLKKYRRTK